MGSGKLYEMLRNLLKKKPEWGTPVAGIELPPGAGAWSDLFELPIVNPALMAISVDVDGCNPGESGVITVEMKIDGSNWRVTNNLQYDDVDINTIDDVATTADATGPKRAHQWLIYVDAGTDVRVSTKQAVGNHQISWRYNIKDEV